MDEFDFHRALARPGTILDIGAHDGALTRRLATIPGARVIAFEPLPSAFARLRLALADAANVTLRPEALGACAGTVTLAVPVVGGAAQEQWASTAKDYAAIQADDPRVTGIERHSVPMLALDDLALADVTAIKLDAEGAEEEILRGAAATLLRCRPVLSVEIEERHRAGSTKAVPAFLAGLGYRGFWEFWGDWRPVEAFDPASMQVGSPSPAAFEVSDPYVFIFYFIPPERLAELAALARLP
jgi:FkbM family methyltransferase